MRFWKGWIVATKDFSVVRKNKYILYSIIAMPLIFGIALPLMLSIMLVGAPVNVVMSLLGMLNGFFAVMAAILPTVIASYSFVGEKVERSLEPLLATPTTDGELLLGKCLAAFLPSMAWCNLHWRRRLCCRHGFMVLHKSGSYHAAKLELGLNIRVGGASGMHLERGGQRYSVFQGKRRQEQHSS